MTHPYYGKDTIHRDTEYSWLGQCPIFLVAQCNRIPNQTPSGVEKLLWHGGSLPGTHHHHQLLYVQVPVTGCLMKPFHVLGGYQHLSNLLNNHIQQLIHVRFEPFKDFTQVKHLTISIHRVLDHYLQNQFFGQLAFFVSTHCCEKFIRLTIL